MKKSLVLIAALLFCVSLLTAQAAKETSELKAPEKIKIEFWYSWGDKIAETNETLAKMFNESQDRIEVVASYQGSYNDLQAKLRAAYVSKTAPTVALNESASVGVFARSGISEDLTSYAKRDGYDLANLNKGLMTNSYVDGKLVSIPYMRSSALMFVNASILKENGLDPAGPKNWDELLAYGKVLSAKGITALSFPIVNEWYFEAFLGQAGGSIFNAAETAPAFNSKAGVEVLSFWRELQDKGYAKILIGSDAGTMYKADFQAQKTAMIISSVADINYFLQVAKQSGFEMNTAFLPKKEKYATPTGGANLILVSNKSEAEKEAGWEFIKFVTQDAQTIYCSQNTGYVPISYSAVNSDVMTKFYAEYPQFKVAVDQLDYMLPRPTIKTGPEVHAKIKEMVTEFLLNKTADPVSLLTKYEKIASDILAGN